MIAFFEMLNRILLIIQSYLNDKKNKESDCGYSDIVDDVEGYKSATEDKIGSGTYKSVDVEVSKD